MRTAIDQRGHRRDPDRGADPGQGRRARRPICADYGDRQLTLVSRPQGLAAVHGRPDAGDPLPVRIDLMEVSLVRRHDDRIVRPRPDPQGPLVDHRGRGRPDRRGHHRHRADPELPRPLPARQEPALAPDLHAPRQAGPPARRHPGRLPSASRSRTSSSSATASTTASYYRNLRFVGVLEPEVYTRRPNDDASPTARRAARRLAAIAASGHRSSAASCRGGSSAAARACRRGPATRSRARASSSSSSALAIDRPADPAVRGATRPVALDRPLSFLRSSAIGWIALAIRAIDLSRSARLGLPTTRPACGSRRSA